MVSVSGTGSGPETIGNLMDGLSTRFRNGGTLWPPGHHWEARPSTMKMRLCAALCRIGLIAA
jgi:hypothetical protein